MSNDLLIGGEAFKAMLSEVSPEQKITELKETIRTTKSVSKRDALIKQLKYLAGLHSTGLKAQDAYVLHNLPVIPPRMRPASVLGSNRLEFADVNNLYKDHMLVNNSLKDLKDMLPPEELVKEREDAYNGVKAIVGLGEAISPNSKGRGVTGLLKQIAGTGGPKTGLFHNKVLSKKQDFSGRATIRAEGQNLGFNEAAIPRDMLWTMYKFHILRDLSKKGYDYVNSEKAWTERSPAAVASFTKMTKSIPVILNRAPTLMKSNITAVYPIPIDGNTIGLNPLHLPMFAGDFDGDAQNLYVPMTAEAINEAKEKLLPQVQINDYRRGLNQSLIAPAHEAILGSVHMTEPDMSQRVVHFKSEEACLKALSAGEIKENTPVEIG